MLFMVHIRERVPRGWPGLGTSVVFSHYQKFRYLCVFDLWHIIDRRLATAVSLINMIYVIVGSGTEIGTTWKLKQFGTTFALMRALVIPLALQKL